MTQTPNDELTFLAGGGEMGELIRAHDWAKTAIGPLESWSPALRMQVSFLLANRFPMLLWWGPTFCSIYNDAYAPILGTKHPSALGRPVSEVWSEIWNVLKPLIETPFSGGPPTWIEDFFLEIRRHGFLEEGHFTVAYSPVPDETAPRGIGGVVATVHEISATVIGERRVAVLRDLGSRAGDAKTAEQACAIAAQTLSHHGRDLPFVLLYLIDAERGAAKLAGVSGVTPGEDISPLRVELDGDAAPWPLAEALRSQDLIAVERLAARFAHLPRGPWSEPPHTAIVAQIPSNKAHEPAGVLVAGITPRVRLDEHHRDFIELLRTQLATAIANARAYEEERKRAEALAEIDRAKTAFFSNVSHEFRTPLTLMLGPVEDLLVRSHTDLAPAAASQLEVVHRNGLRLLRLVNTLLDFSRIEAGRARATYQSTDLALFTSDLASVFRAAVERAGLRFVVDCPPLEEPVFIDRDMWEKIVLNLLSNAFKFTFDGEIRVTLRAASSHVVLQVKDTGTGIRAEEMPRLFERFHRIENARSRTHEGSGIGLALVQELVKLHGGTISAESVIGEGTTFTISLPLGSMHLSPEQIVESRTLDSTVTGAAPYVEEAWRWLPDAERIAEDFGTELPTPFEAMPVPARAPESDREATRPLVLVADDNADMRQYVVRLLAERYRVDAVADGAAALAAARICAPDLVLTDVMMPQLDGFGLMQALRAHPATRDVPVIMLSARAGEESRVEGIEAGADDYLIKPFSARELLARVAAHLQMARMRREAEEAIRQRGEQFETLLDQAPLGVYLVDADFRIREVNPIARPFFGDIEGGVVGRDFGEVIHHLWDEDYADEIVQIFRHTLATGEPHVTRERGEVRADLQVTEYYEWRVDRIILPDGRYGVVCYFRDISAQVLARKDLEQSREALGDADRRKDEFLATLAHELRNPLAPMRNAIEILRRARGNTELVERARATMERQVSQMVRLVDDLLDVSRIARNQLSLRTETVDLASIIHRVVETCRPLADAAQHELRVTMPSEPVPLYADPARLAQVFGNLLTNACKFTEQGGLIEISAGSEVSGDPSSGAREAFVRIRDTGVGIEADMLDRVFEMFTQVDRSLERTRGGLGIGLTLVKRLVEMHGGSVTAHSAGPGRGSEFTVRLPMLSGAQLASEQPAMSSSANPSSNGAGA
jgi:PAS domain S-box-containing protein